METTERSLDEMFESINELEYFHDKIGKQCKEMLQGMSYEISRTEATVDKIKIWVGYCAQGINRGGAWRMHLLLVDNVQYSTMYI